MDVKLNAIIFTSENKERKSVRRLEEKKLQILFDSNYNFPSFEVDSKEYIKDTVSNKIVKILGTSKFYIEQLYSWGNVTNDTKNSIIITYLVIVNKSNILNLDKKYKFCDINISEESIKENKVQKVVLNNDLEYKIQTIRTKEKDNIEFQNKLIDNSNFDELNAIIIHTAIKRLRVRIENTNIAFSFLNPEFTLSELQQVYEIILDKKLVTANFRKKIAPMVKKTDKIIKESAYRPSQRYVFNYDYVKDWV